MRPPGPVSARLCDVLCLALALWTLCAHLAVAAEASLRALVIGYGIAGAAALALGLAASRRAGAGQSGPATPAAEVPSPVTPRLRRGLRGGGAVLGLAAALALGTSPLAFWAAAVALLGAAAALLVLAEAPRLEPAARGRRLEAGLWTLALACAVLALVVHRPDLDDAFYVNLAVAAADFPGRALLAGDSMHGDGALPLMLPIYRAHSYELAVGALAWLSGRPAMELFHFGAAALAALAVPLAHARAFRWLAPRHWLWATAATVFVLVAAGETHRWYGNFGFVRIWQGKSIFLFVFLPLIYAYAVEFAARPSRGAWLRLAAAQVAAVGCSSSALWGAPVAAWMALCCVLRPTRGGLRRFALGALASGYVLGVAWILKQGMEQSGQLPTLGNKDFSPGAQLGLALDTVLGEGRLRLFALASLIAAWACCPRGLGQRFAIVLPLAGFLVLLDPFLSKWVLSNLTSSSYWRAFWALPVPMLMALVLVAPLQLGRPGPARIAAAAGCALALLGFAAWLPAYSTLSPRNVAADDLPIRIGRPGLKVPEPSWRWAKIVNEQAPPRSPVIAPRPVAIWIPTFHGHAYPVAVRRSYLRLFMGEIGEDQARLRLLLTLFAQGELEGPEAVPLFRAGLDRFRPGAVLLRRSPLLPEARRILRDGGFEPGPRDLTHELWLRKPAPEARLRPLGPHVGPHAPERATRGIEVLRAPGLARPVHRHQEAPGGLDLAQVGGGDRLAGGTRRVGRQHAAVDEGGGRLLG